MEQDATTAMPREIFPSYFCDCGAESHHFERTIWELKQLSKKKRRTLIADDDKHRIIFHRGEFVGMWCPEEQREIPADNSG